LEARRRECGLGAASAPEKPSEIAARIRWAKHRYKQADKIQINYVREKRMKRN